jgi:RNA polymerase sigma factor (TIGR02999 family)
VPSRDKSLPWLPSTPAPLASQRPHGRPAAELFGLLYRELHRMAGGLLRRQRAALGATTLVHESYLALHARTARFPDEARFFAYVARVMRGVIVGHARASRALKRGGGTALAPLDGEGAPEPAAERSRLGDALDTLAATDPDLSELVDLRFFAGLSLRDIAAMRGVSERTVQRDWDEARRCLQRLLAS